MIKHCLIAVLTVLVVATASRQGHAQSGRKPLDGTWQGMIGGSLPLVFHFVSSPSGEISGSFDSPKQHAMGLSMSSVKVTEDSLVCMINSPAASYTAARVNDSTFTGTWNQGGIHVPLQIRKETDSEAKAYTPPVRPQTPHPPFPYNSDSVEYDNAAGTVHLGATLSYPKSGGPFPVAVLITGSGIQDRDETIFSHKPFAVIADYLTRRGYAVLRVDDRTAGLSRGEVRSATSEDFALDVETSLHYLKTRKEIDTTRMGLIGHSEGGMIAPMVAARDKSVAFIILLAGPAEGGYRTMMYQSGKPLVNAGVDASRIKYSAALEDVALRCSAASKDSTELVRCVDSAYRGYPSQLADSLKIPAAEVMSADKYTMMIAAQAHILTSPWWRFFLSYNPHADFASLECPILALGGSEDIQVHNAACFEAMRAMVNQKESRNLDTQLFPGLNHLFQHCHACTVDEYGELTETFSPEALKVMADWMDVHVRKGAPN